MEILANLLMPYSYLEILFDFKLKYQEHINSLKIKLLQLCGICYRISPYLNLEAAKAHYYSFVYSALSYNCLGWYTSFLD